MAEVTLTPSRPYAYYVFESGFSAHWVRLVTDVGCANCTAMFTYT